MPYLKLTNEEYNLILNRRKQQKSIHFRPHDYQTDSNFMSMEDISFPNFNQQLSNMNDMFNSLSLNDSIQNMSNNPNSYYNSQQSYFSSNNNGKKKSKYYKKNVVGNSKGYKVNINNNGRKSSKYYRHY